MGEDSLDSQSESVFFYILNCELKLRHEIQRFFFETEFCLWLTKNLNKLSKIFSSHLSNPLD